MKVGFSYSRCVRDIVDGKVDITDVVVIIARTDFDPNNDAHWQSIWEGYTYGGMNYAEWANHTDKEDEFRTITKNLYNYGKLHQPRKFGARAERMNEHWYDLTVRQIDMNPSVKKAYENYRMLAGISGK